MLIPNASVVRGIYESHDYLSYPEMTKALDAALKDPTRPIEVPNNFLNKKAESQGFFSGLLSKIATKWQGAMISLKCALSKEYSVKFNRAVKQIETAYSKKISDISNLAQIIMCSKEPIESTKEIVYKLQGRIKELEESVEEDEMSLKEMIEAKNLIIDDARALLKLQSEPQEDTNFFWKFIGFFTPQKTDPAKALMEEINDIDASFPTGNISEDLIEAYEREQVENSQLLTSIQLKKRHITHVQQLLVKEQELLVEAQALLKKAAAQISKAAQDIERLQLEDYFDEDDLEVPDISLDSAAPMTPKELTPQEKMMEDIGKDISTKTGVKELSTLFKLLLGRFPEDAVKNWNCDDQGKFSLELKQCYQLWIPGGSLPGGAVLLFGDPGSALIKGKLEKNKFTFESGISSYVKVFPLGFISPTLDTIHFQDKTDIALSGAYLGQSETKHKTFTQLKSDWGSKGSMVPTDYPGGYQKFLQDKIAEG
ncbi:hypothetical protein [Estrella lausannensis]|uniref:Uncharacterized protein n=1 Tax=Estrella lausannensis TaxID=483423 RepID=A0A0H5E4Q4_9BACT|nr:hypothetical protein [Estrella lausannensis]CRX38220.1 hypothetical protein ELAC_0871 [Estrella lausannensis]